MMAPTRVNPPIYFSIQRPRESVSSSSLQKASPIELYILLFFAESEI
jgi:hypothetical protein